MNRRRRRIHSGWPFRALGLEIRASATGFRKLPVFMPGSVGLRYFAGNGQGNARCTTTMTLIANDIRLPPEQGQVTPVYSLPFEIPVE